MTFTKDQIAALNAPLSGGHVKQRQQSGRKLSYIEGWHAIAEANRIFGFDGWTREAMDIRLVAERERRIGQNGDMGWGVSYIARVRVTVGGIVREGVGSGHGIDRDLGLAHESAIKEAETDAMKRALMTFGNPFGLALYDKDQANVTDDNPNSARGAPPVAARNAGAVQDRAPVAGGAKSAAPAPDSPALAALTMAAKLAKTAADLESWEADNAEAIAALEMDDAQKLRTRIDWLKANRLAQVAA